MDLKLSKLSQAMICFLCAILTWRFEFPLEGSEFRGGTVTGPILNMSNVGVLLFMVALPMAFVSPRRIAGVVMLLASLLCLPIYLYFTFPGIFRSIFQGQYSIPLQADVVLEEWSVIGFAALVIAASFGFRCLLWSTPGKRRAS
jgi:hypothetical protein